MAGTVTPNTPAKDTPPPPPAKKGRGLWYISQRGMQYFGEGLNRGLSVQLTAEVVADMEIIDKDKLSQLIASFIQAYTIPPSKSLLIFAPDLIFEKDIKTTTPDEQLEEKKSFESLVPFTSIASRLYMVNTINKLAVINHDLFQLFKTELEKKGFEVMGAIPYFVLMSGSTSFTTLTDQIARDVLKKMDFYAEARFDQTTFVEKSSIDYEVIETSDQQTKSHVPALLSVFFLLIGVLGVVAFTVNRQPQTTQSSAVENVASPTPFVTPTLEPTIAPTLPPLSTFTIRIFNGSGQPGQAETVRGLLIESGFSAVTTGNATGSVSRSEVVFKSTVPQSVRQLVIDSLSSLLTQPAIIENEEASEDVVITTGEE